MLECLYCYIYVQLYKQPRQERECCMEFSRFHRCAQVNRAVCHKVCSQFKAKNKSHTFFEKVESSWKLSSYIPPYKLVMQKTGGSQKLMSSGISFGGSALKTGCRGCRLGAAGSRAASPKSWPTFLRSVPRKGNQEGFGERQNSKKGKTNSKLRREGPISKSPGGRNACPSGSS